MEQKTRKIKWVPILLGVSLALNLAVLAAVGAAALRFRSGDHEVRRAGPGQAPYLQALSKTDRRALRNNLRKMPRPRQVHYEQMLEALRQDPFDPAAVRQVLEGQRTDILARQDAASTAWLAHVTDMSVSDRATYAERLSDLLERHRARREPHRPRD